MLTECEGNYECSVGMNGDSDAMRRGRNSDRVGGATKPKPLKVKRGVSVTRFSNYTRTQYIKNIQFTVLAMSYLYNFRFFNFSISRL